MARRTGAKHEKVDFGYTRSLVGFVASGLLQSDNHVDRGDPGALGWRNLHRRKFVIRDVGQLVGVFEILVCS